MNEPDVVTVRGLRKSYGARVVVDGLDLTVPAGEIACSTRRNHATHRNQLEATP